MSARNAGSPLASQAGLASCLVARAVKSEFYTPFAFEIDKRYVMSQSGAIYRQRFCAKYHGRSCDAEECIVL